MLVKPLHSTLSTEHCTLSVVLATYNEEFNIGPCLESVKNIADEIIVYDEFSGDKTREIAKKYKARVFKYNHKINFHETKQRAINKSSGDWILQLDADERVTPKLAEEITQVITMDYDILPALKGGVSPSRMTYQSSIHPRPSGRGFLERCYEQLLERTPQTEKQKSLFERHQKLIESREGKLGKRTGEVVAFFIPRLNFFLGKPLIHAGVYPDGVIRLFKKGKARLPGKSVHELMEVDGEIGWLFNNLEHHESPTFSRYLERANRYTDLSAKDYKNKKLPLTYWNLFNYSFLIPCLYFLKLYIRHLGFLDGMRGFVWSVFSAFHYPIAYFKYYSSIKNNTYPSKLQRSGKILTNYEKVR